MILLNLIQNIALLMALILAQQLLSSNITMRRLNRYPHMASVLSGFIFGSVGIVGMMTPLHFAPGIIFDGRSIILAVAGLFGGPVIAAIAAGICGAYRLWLGGGGALMGVSVIGESAALGVVFYYLRLHNPALMTNFILLGFGFLVHTVMVGMMMLLPAASSVDVMGRIGPPVLVVFPVATMLICRLFINLQEGEKNKKALLESEKNYRELVECANSIILRWEQGGSITFFNEFAEKFFGFSKEEILGKSVIGTIVPERDSTNRDLRAMVDDIVRNPDKYAQNENENMRKDGSRVWVSWTNRAIFDSEGKLTGFLAIGNDITARKQMELELREGTARLSKAQEIAHLGSWDLDISTKRLIWSDEVYRIFGLQAQEFKASFEAFLDAVHPEDRAAVDKAYSESLQKGLDGYEIMHRVVRKKTGEVRYVYEKCHHFKNDAGSIVRSSGMVLDITERRQAEAALQAKNEELVHFNYTVSHDLKSPLVTIKTFLGYLEQDMAKADTEHVAQDLGFIHTAADRMNALLEELLDLSRIGRVVNPPVEVPFQELVQDALDLVAGRITERCVQVVVGQEPSMLYGDRPCLVKVFQNLVDNAVKFMGPQKEPFIEIGTEKKNGDILFFVRDNGMGIDMRYKDRLFGLFDKLDAHSEGSGMGLALAKRIIEVHGGRIWVESAGLGKGACFWFTLPRKSSES